jgi:hypothetical protein
MCVTPGASLQLLQGARNLYAADLQAQAAAGTGMGSDFTGVTSPMVGSVTPGIVFVRHFRGRQCGSQSTDCTLGFCRCATGARRAVSSATSANKSRFRKSKGPQAAAALPPSPIIVAIRGARIGEKVRRFGRVMALHAALSTAVFFWPSAGFLWSSSRGRLRLSMTSSTKF